MKKLLFSMLMLCGMVSGLQAAGQVECDAAGAGVSSAAAAARHSLSSSDADSWSSSDADSDSDSGAAAAAAAGSDYRGGDGGGGGGAVALRSDDNPTLIYINDDDYWDAGEQRRTPKIETNSTRLAIGAAITVAALTAAVKSIMSIRSYRRMKNKLVRKYDLGNLTSLQDKVWMATFVSHRMPYFMHRLVRNNAGKMLTDFTGKDPLALAHFYYGHKPSQAEYDTFIKTFFNNVNR